MKILPILVLSISFLLGCTKDIRLEDLPQPKNQLVVEGSIETNSPPLIFLTRNFPYYGDFNLNDVSSYFVHGANIRVDASSGESTVLKEYCTRDYFPLLSVNQKVELMRVFGFNYNADSITKYFDSTTYLPNICFYSTEDIFTYYLTGTARFMGKEKTTYTLSVQKDTFNIEAQTTIPAIIAPQGLTYKNHPNPSNDSLVTVFVEFSVPDTFGNFVRYWTKRNTQPFYLPRSRSVWDDKVWVGSSNIKLPIERGQPRRVKLDDAYSYFWKGDSVVLKWANIDKKTYDFWSTLERDNGDNPLSSPVLVKSNIKGGLGIWGGYAISTRKIYIPKK